MSAETPAPAPTAPAPTAAPPAVAPATPAQESTDWKAEARKHEARAKEYKAAADELAALKASQMTEAEKSAKALAEAQAELAKYQTREQVAKWSEEIVKDSTVPASALRGSTREELAAHFEQLKALIPAPAPATTPPGLVGPYVPNEGKPPEGALNGDPLLDALKTKLGIQ